MQDKNVKGMYEELINVSINDSDIILSESHDAKYRYRLVENRYTTYYNKLGENNVYTGYTNDYLEALSEFTNNLQHQINCVQSRRDMHKHTDGVEYVELKSADCLPDSHNDDFTGKLIIVKASELKPEYRSSENQLVLCSHGNGARPGALGTSVFAKELLSGESVCFGRHQIEGVADPEKLPKWAAEIIAGKEPRYQMFAEKPARPPNEKLPPSLLDELDDAKAEAAARNTASKNSAQTKKRDGLEV
jgi:hypothetical protein